MTTTVVVVGGGYGGVAVAKALDDIAHVVLVEPRDAFVHNVAALRALADPQWINRLFLPYDRLLNHGRLLRDRAVRVGIAGATLGSGRSIGADYLVLATGSTYPFPAKIDTPNSAEAKGKIRVAHDAVARADRVLLLGAGAVGLELAGEIKAAWPDKAVTIVDPGTDLLSGGYIEQFRAELRRQLDVLGVELILGTSLLEAPPSDPGEAKTFTLPTRSGRPITADVWFQCFGVAPVSDYLADDLIPARRADGHLEVTAELRLPGQDRVFAIGDLTAIAETKTAKAAGQHAEVVATNIRSLIHGHRELTTYTPEPPGISLPLGPTGGASYSPHLGVLDAKTTSAMKGADLRTSSYAELLRVG